MSTSTTWFFNDIFPNYDSWKEVIQQTNIVDYSKDDERAFDEYCFGLLSRHYANSNIRYFEIQAFICELVNVYQSKFRQFKKQKDLIDKMYSLTDEELMVVGKSLINMANNPNDMPEDPNQPLNFISAQTYNQQLSSKLEGYLKALNNIPSLSVYKFFKPNEPSDMGFDDLFMNIQPNDKYIYGGII